MWTAHLSACLSVCLFVCRSVCLCVTYHQGLNRLTDLHEIQCMNSSQKLQSNHESHQIGSVTIMHY